MNEKNSMPQGVSVLRVPHVAGSSGEQGVPWGRDGGEPRALFLNDDNNFSS